MYLIKILIIILYITIGVGDFFINFLGIDKNKGPYYLINKIYNYNNGTGIKIVCILFTVDIIIICIMFFLLILTNAKKKLLIIQHLSLQKMNFTYNDEIDNYKVKKIKIDQYSILNNETICLDKKIKLLIQDVDKSSGEILSLVEKKGYQVGYSGIANIPATFMLGYELGDENKKIFFHKFRNNSDDDDDFHILKNEQRQLNFTCTKEIKNNLSKTGKILLLIQLTQPIGDEDIKNISEENDYVIKYEIPMTINYDVVDSSHQINRYTNTILAKIAEIQKNPNITQIKICVAASSSFIFALGTKFSKTQNKETIIFHYENKTYPWGINVTKKEPVIIKKCTSNIKNLK